jgi:hypothetical protein
VLPYENMLLLSNGGETHGCGKYSGEEYPLLVVEECSLPV